MLYRLFYQRAGSTRTVTFHADNLIDVCDFIALWERLAKVTIHGLESARAELTRERT